VKDACARDRHIFGPGPKRILSLDGGGIRGVITLAFLERLEQILARRTGMGDAFRLGDYFDLVGGTSVGSLIAAGLVLRYPTGRLIELFEELGGTVFKAPFFRTGLLGAKFPLEPLRKILRRELGDLTLGSERICTGLAIVAKRLDTGSVWLMHNNPHGKFFGPDRDDPSHIPNRDYPLHQVVRASMAAPTFFDPEQVEIVRGLRGFFIDGAVSPYANPALKLFMLATIRGYGFEWAVGPDRMMLVSVGTGARPGRFTSAELRRIPSGLMAVEALMAMMEDCNWHTQAILQWLGQGSAHWDIDAEVGTLDAAVLNGRKLLSYARFNVVLETEWLARELGCTATEKELAELRRMDRPKNVPRLLEIARLAAARQVTEDSVPAAFDSGVRAGV
jgi:hypothetical protein